MNRPLPIDPLYFPPQTAHLSAVELGILTRCALHFWLLGGLPEDPVSLARIGGVDMADMEAARQNVMPFFEAGGLFSDLRKIASERSERVTRAGRIGGLHSRRGAAKSQEGGS